MEKLTKKEISEIESKVRKQESKKKLRNFIIPIILVVTFMGVYVVASNYISSSGTSTLTGTWDFENVTADEINSVLYVQAGNGSDIQRAFDECATRSLNRCVVITNDAGDNYLLDKTLNFTASNIVWVNYGVISSASGADWYSITDLQSDTFSMSIYSNGYDNLRIYNYGKIGKYDGNSFPPVFINDSKNLYISAGEFDVSPIIANSEDVTLENVIRRSNANLGPGYTGECNKGVNLNNFQINNSGGEGEIIESNAYDSYLNINNIIGFGNISATDDEAIDINGALYVNINNVQIKEAGQFFTVSTTAGVRYGVCDAQTGDFINIRNAYCEDCAAESLFQVANRDIEYFENGIKKGQSSYVPENRQMFGRLLIGANNSNQFPTGNHGGSSLAITNSTPGGFAQLTLFSDTRAGSPTDGAFIYFGESQNDATHWIKLDGIANELILETKTITDQIRIPRDSKGIIIGDGNSQYNITLTSPDGTEYSCGVLNGGTFVCS